MSTDRTALSKIRRSSSAANDIVRALVPKRHLIGVLKAVAHSVEVADQASPSKWGLRLSRKSVMLKVGFVEVLQFGDGWFHELALRDVIPKKLRTNRRLKFTEPPYKNAPGCEACDMPLTGQYKGVRPTLVQNKFLKCLRLVSRMGCSPTPVYGVATPCHPQAGGVLW